MIWFRFKKTFTTETQRAQRNCILAGPGDDGPTNVLSPATSQLSAFPYLTLIDRCFSYAVVFPAKTGYKHWQRGKIISLCVLCASSAAGGEIGQPI
jgi:hypothetical protein